MSEKSFPQSARPTLWDISPEFSCRRLGQNGKVKTLPVAVQAFVGSYVKQWDLILTAALLAMIPMIIVFLLAQKQIVNGMVEDAIK